MLLSAGRGGRRASQAKAASLLRCFLSVREAGGGGKPESGFVTQAFLAAHVFLLADVNVAFQQSAHKVLLDDDNLLPLLHLTIEYHGKEHKGLPFFLASFCSYWSSSVLLPLASIHLHRDLRNHLVQCPNFKQEGVERGRDAQAEVSVFVVLLEWSLTPPDLKVEKRISKSQEPHIDVFLPLQVSFMSPLCF